MVNFEYYAPTRVVFGRDTEQQVGKLVKEYGATRVLVHSGGQSARKSGLLDRVLAALQKAGVAYVELAGVVPNPHLSLVRQGIDLCREQGVDFLLAVGGGSVLDSAKAIGYGVPYEGDVWDFYAGKAVAQKALPLGAVVTVAAAGSEMSDSSVITDEQTHTKRGYSNNLGRPVFAIMNPELTRSLPAFPTACGVADIMMHTLERYFYSPEEEGSEMTDAIAEGLLRVVMDSGRTLTREPENYNARAEVLWAGSLSHNGLTGCGNGRGDWSVHQLGHELSGLYDIAHGAALTAMWGSWARFVYKQDPARFARLGVEVLDIPEEDTDEATALAAIEELEGFFWGLELPTSIAELELDLSDEDLHNMAVRCSRGGSRTIGTFMELNERAMEGIYRMAREEKE